jgi:hypothetical protein
MLFRYYRDKKEISNDLKNIAQEDKSYLRTLDKRIFMLKIMLSQNIYRSE